MNYRGLWVALPAVAILLLASTLVRNTGWKMRPADGTRSSQSIRIDIYRHAGFGDLNPAVVGAPRRVYVPDIQSGDVSVIDPLEMRVVARFPVGANPQHIVPSWDLRTLWVTGSSDDHRQGSLTPIDPLAGRPGRTITVPDAYNLYFTFDGRAAIVVAEQQRRLEFRDPHSMELKATLSVPDCAGVNHADFSADGRFAIFTCEFGGALIKIDMNSRVELARLTLSKNSMPQDIRAGPDGKLFFVADMMADGVYLVDGSSFAVTGFIRTGPGAHGLCVSRDGRMLYVSNRGSHTAHGSPRGPGSVSVIDFAAGRVIRNWPIPGGGSPDMGNVSADGTSLWLSGRYDGVVYRIDTSTGAVTQIPVGREPHGLTVWPQPGRFSLGHTGNMR